MGHGTAPPDRTPGEQEGVGHRRFVTLLPVRDGKSIDDGSDKNVSSHEISDCEPSSALDSGRLLDVPIGTRSPRLAWGSHRGLLVRLYHEEERLLVEVRRETGQDLERVMTAPGPCFTETASLQPSPLPEPSVRAPDVLGPPSIVLRAPAPPRTTSRVRVRPPASR